MDKTLKELGIEKVCHGTFCGEWLNDALGTNITVFSPIDDSALASIQCSTNTGYDKVVSQSAECFNNWRAFPAPKRGEVIRQIGEKLRANKSLLARLITLECGKIISESEGEVQEAIDIADFAVGLSRQLYGLSMHSERSDHRMYEQWHPLGPIGVISAFNFPLAVWAWNAFVAAVCGDTIIWKPSEQTPLIAIAATKLCSEVSSAHGFPALFTLVNGDKSIGELMADDPRLPLISATGSTRMGKDVAKRVASRLGRSLLELGGNNALIVLKDADLDLAAKAVCFGAAGTAGQRCTTTRRLLISKDIQETFLRKLIELYKSLKIGNPLENNTLVGPLINKKSVEIFLATIEEIPKQGGKILHGGKLASGPSGLYVEPTIAQVSRSSALLQQEVFAPILFVVTIANLDEAIEINNEVPQGLSSALFTDSVKASEQFLSYRGSDCGIANINIGTSGAEIGGAFGGEKETGGGRESGSDSWKAYMRRQTSTINWSNSLPLAQGVKFAG